MANYLPNRTKVAPSPYGQTAPAPNSTYNPTGGNSVTPGGGGNMFAGAGGSGQSQQNPNAALDQNAMWNAPWAQQQRQQGWQGYGQSSPLPGQQAYGYDPWAGNAAGKTAFDQQRTAAMNSFGGFGPPGSAPTTVPPPPGGPPPNDSMMPGGVQPNAPQLRPDQLGQTQGSMAPQQQGLGGAFGGGMDQFAQMLQQQFGMDANQFQQFLSWLSSQQMGQQQQPQAPDMTWQGGN